MKRGIDMHINAKRMKRRIDKAQGIEAEPDVIRDAIRRPAYLKAATPGDRAQLLGLSITEAPDSETGGTAYIIAGGCLKDLEEPARELDSPAALAAEINILWDIMTEPDVEYYQDAAGRLHERLVYPELNY